MTPFETPADPFALLFATALDLFRRPSPSGEEDLVRAYVLEHLERHGFTTSVDPAGNVLAVRGIPDPAEGYPLFSFHMDCVSAGRPRKASRHAASSPCAAELALLPLEMLDLTRGWLHSNGAFVLGGDDKCGGALALTLAATTDIPLKIVASVQEEIGCVGIEQVDPHFFADVAYALVLDRRGANHLVVSIGGQVLCQGTFAAAMMRAAAETGLVVYAVEGALSDARTLAWYIPNVVNVSVGYYRPHSTQERVSLSDLWHSYQWVAQALRSLPRQFTLDQRSAPPEREDAVICPQCQKLTISPGDLSADLQMFVCHCAEAALPAAR
jgi:hypothetical protein